MSQTFNNKIKTKGSFRFHYNLCKRKEIRRLSKRNEVKKSKSQSKNKKDVKNFQFAAEILKSSFFQTKIHDLAVGILSKRVTSQKTMFRKQEAPAADRNKAPILEVLKDIIRVPGAKGDFPSIKILEISSGTGQHVAYFAKHLNPQIFWQPTEYDTSSFSSICAYIQEYQLKNVAPPVFVDIRQDFKKWNPICGELERTVTNLQPVSKFEEESFDYIYNANLIHISAFDCAEGLFSNSGKLLKKNGCLLTYGPYGQNGVISPQSNIQFDAGLRASNPSWGVRDIQLQLEPLAEKNNLKLEKIIDMPSNNKTLIWQKL